MASLETQFINIQKKIRQEARTKMLAKMERAAEKIVSRVSKYKEYQDVTGNLYKSTAVGVYNNGTLMSIHHTPGPDPTRLTLAAGERYNLENYYDGTPVRLHGRPYRGEFGRGREAGVYKGEEKLFDNDGVHSKWDLTWQLKVVAGVEYASFVENIKKHDVITGVRDYLVRYFKSM